MPTRDELLGDISTEVKRVIPENKDLDGDELASISETIADIFENTEKAMDEAEEEDDEGNPSNVVQQ